MPHQDTTYNTICLIERELKELPLLKPGKAVTIDYSFLDTDVDCEVPAQSYNSDELYKFAYKLMETLRITYKRQDNTRVLEFFSEEEKKQLYPFACFLAILDGNCFKDFIEQYIPDAYAIITSNGRNDLQEILKRLNKEDN